MADLKVLMVPQPNPARPGMSGIDRVVEAYARHLPDFGISLVKPKTTSYDVLAVHAGLTAGTCSVCHCHGLYWTADYNDAPVREYGSNAMIIEALRQARQVTVPSAWVAETIQRDMRFSPHVIPHGIDWDAWQHAEPPGNYVLWNKNRIYDVCDPTPVVELAQRFKGGKFVTTFVPRNHPHMGNVTVTGLLPPEDMKRKIQAAAVYLATTKETFGIGILEAMAAGVPVLGYRHGGVVDLVEHGVNGYLATPGDLDDLAAGLAYCLQYRATLGANGRELARRWRWPDVVERVAGVYRLAAENEPPTVGVVIPVYNKSEAEVRRAVESVLKQSYRVSRLVIVDDGSDDETVVRGVVESYGGMSSNIHLIRQQNSGVAVARNRGISHANDTKYICCLDADDWLAPGFLQVCVDALERDPSLGVAYTSLYYHKPDGSHGISPWPGAWDYDKQLQRQNQIPTCCVFRREAWARLGGYRGRYAPHGAGEEDAEFWTRLGAYGYKAALVEPHATAVPKYLDLKARLRRVPDAQALADAGLADVWPKVQDSFFHYSWQSGLVSSQPGHKPTDWLAWHPWARDHKHPFASYATPINGRSSHPVRQYDQPLISVIIPVGPGHERVVIDALDSLEAQTFRKWEAIVVWDSEAGIEIIGGTKDRIDIEVNQDVTDLVRAYPYVRWLSTSGKCGAGHARNLGASFARAPFLFFLDADDWLYPAALQSHLDAWAEYKAIIYSDYVGKAIGVDPRGLAGDIEVLAYFEERDEHVLGYRAADFDCERAQRQPELPRPFIWCNVTALIPKAWHEAIGGFDESMESWEDVDYHWRLARAGYCYHHIPERLLVYRFYTGSRRDDGLQKHKSLVQYLKSKYEGIPMSPCSGCGGGSARQRTISSVGASTIAPAMRLASPGASGKVAIADEQYVLVQDVTGKRGDRPIVGPVTKHQYGHHQSGDKFLMHKDDVFTIVDKRTGRIGLLQPRTFEPVVERELEPPPVEVEELPPPEPLVEPPVEWPELAEPGLIERPFDLQLLPGVGPSRAAKLEEAGLTGRETILEVGVAGLKRAGLTSKHAAQIVEYLSSE